MSNLYHCAYTNQALGRARAPITIATGKRKCIRVEFPAEGYLNRLIVWQAGGTNKAFTVELFNSVVPHAVGEADYNDAYAVNLEPYRIQHPVTAAISAISGAVLSLVSSTHGFPYRNLDGTPTNEQGYVYLVITPDNSTDLTTWHAFLEARQEHRA